MQIWVFRACAAATVAVCAAVAGSASGADGPPAFEQNRWPVADRPVASMPAPYGGGDLVTYSDLGAFELATGGLSMRAEDFGGGLTPAAGLRICFQAVSSASDDPCFRPGDLEPGFGIRSSRGSIFDSQVRDSDLVVLGPVVLGTPSVVIGSNVPGSPANPTQVSFDPAVTAVGMDVYDGKTGDPVEVGAFAADGSLIGSFEVDPSAPNAPAFAGFTSSVPVARVGVVATAVAGGALLGNLRYGGGAGRLALASATLDFDATAVHADATQMAIVQNDGALDLEIGAVPAPTAPFSVTSDGCSGQALAAGDDCELVYGFHPDQALAFSAQVAIPSDDPATPVTTLRLRGQGVAPHLAPIPGNLDFGSVPVAGLGQVADLALANFGAATLTIAAIAAPSAPFSRTGGDCAEPPFDLAPGSQCTIEFVFDPASAGYFNAVLDITSNAVPAVTTVNLIGAGGQP